MIDGTLLKVAETVHCTEVDGDILVFSDTDHIHRLSGPLSPLAKDVLELLQVSQSVPDILEALPNASREEVVEVIDTLQGLNLLVWDEKFAALSSAEMAQHRLLINHLASSTDPADVGRRARLIIDARVAIHGTGLLGTRIAMSLAMAGIKSVRLVGNDDQAVSGEDCKYIPGFSAREAGLGPKSFASRLAELFPECSVSSATASEDRFDATADLNIVCPDVYNDAFYRRINNDALALGQPWLLCAYLKGSGILLSFRPYSSACYICYRSRMSGNIQDPDLFDRELEARSLLSHLQSAFLPRVEMTTSLAAHEALILMPYLTRASRDLFDCRREATSEADYQASQRHLMAEEPLTWSSEVQVGGSPLAIEQHPVLRLPRCPACGVTKDHRVPTTPWVMPL